MDRHCYALAFGPDDGDKTPAPGGGIYGVEKATGTVRRLIPKNRDRERKIRKDKKKALRKVANGKAK